MIGIKWVYRKKLDENGKVTRNKERLVCKGYVEEEGIEYGETFPPIARLEGVIYIQRFQILSNGCEIHIFEWYIRRKSLHRTTRRIF